MPAGFRGVSWNASTVAIAVTLPTGTVEGDFLVLATESASGQVLAPPTGFTEAPNSPQDDGANTRLSVFYKAVGAAEPSVSIADSGDHVNAVLFAFHGVTTTGLLQTAGAIEGSDNSVTFPVIAEADIRGGDLVLHLAALHDDWIKVTDITANSLALPDQPNVTGLWQSGHGHDGGVLWVFGYSKTGAATDSTATLNGNPAKGLFTLTIEPDPATSNQQVVSRLSFNGFAGKTTEQQISRVGLGAAARSVKADEIQVPRLALAMIVETKNNRRRNYGHFTP